MNIYDQLPRPFFVLAPMDDVTDLVFRQTISNCSRPDLFFTEFVNVDGLQSPGRSKLIHKLKYSLKGSPIIAQIWGKQPENFYKTARELVDMGFAGIDINMGCPDKKIVKNGCCIALVGNRPLAADIIAATKKGADGQIPVSVKTRLGLQEVDMSWIEFLLTQKIAALTIHGRTKNQLSKVPADWSYINEARKLRDSLGLETRIIGNGDVLNRVMGLELAKKYKLDGIMIGRGVFADPFAFSHNSPWINYSSGQKKQLYAEHIKLFIKTWQKNEVNMFKLRKFAKVYINDFTAAKDLRMALMGVDSYRELLDLLK